MATKPIKFVELHYTMNQFLIMLYILFHIDSCENKVQPINSLFFFIKIHVIINLSCGLTEFVPTQ